MNESSIDVSRAAASASLLFLLKGWFDWLGWLVLTFLFRVMEKLLSLSLVLSTKYESGLRVDSKFNEFAESQWFPPSTKSIEDMEPVCPKKTRVSSSESAGGGVMNTESPVP